MLLYNRIRMLLPTFLLLLGCDNAQTDRFQGYVEGEFVYIASPIAGRLTQLSVTRGDSVNQDQLLFRLDDDNEHYIYQQVKQQLQAEQAHLNDLQTGQRQDELNIIQAQLDQATAAQQLSASKLARDLKQFKNSQAISVFELETSQIDDQKNRARVAELTSQLKTGQLPARQEQINAQQSKVLATQAQLAQAQWSLDQKQIKTTMAAQVFDTLYREGEWVPSGHPIVTLLPPNYSKVRFFIAESQLSQLKIGRAVSIECDGCRDAIPGTIQYISPQAEYTPPIIYSNERREKMVFLVEARPIDGNPITLHPGQPVTVVIL